MDTISKASTHVSRLIDKRVGFWPLVMVALLAAGIWSLATTTGTTGPGWSLIGAAINMAVWIGSKRVPIT